jgi:hypothetical protein
VGGTDIGSGGEAAQKMMMPWGLSQNRDHTRSRHPIMRVPACYCTNRDARNGFITLRSDVFHSQRFRGRTPTFI